ncbi:hypothetical protein QBC36DRAFT_98974 [Triangularia setosa]|uniref:Uncharacterized protein n=1 Tax=Triangularia setosa TaxID=2587417 RepID=A0AAN6VZ02_9PEZI|nr:hypothetical protein QBC36DRAFT_98974 [Podospora setosa]
MDIVRDGNNRKMRILFGAPCRLCHCCLHCLRFASQAFRLSKSTKCTCSARERKPGEKKARLIDGRQAERSFALPFPPSFNIGPLTRKQSWTPTPTRAGPVSGKVALRNILFKLTTFEFMPSAIAYVAVLPSATSPTLRDEYILCVQIYLHADQAAGAAPNIETALLGCERRMKCGQLDRTSLVTSIRCFHAQFVDVVSSSGG